MDVEILRPIIDYAFKANHCMAIYSFYPKDTDQEALRKVIETMDSWEAIRRGDIIYFGSWNFIENIRPHYPDKLVCALYLGAQPVPTDPEELLAQRRAMPAISKEFLDFCNDKIPGGGLYMVAAIGNLGRPQPLPEGPPPPEGVVIGGKEALNGMQVQTLHDEFMFPYVCFLDKYKDPGMFCDDPEDDESDVCELADCHYQPRVLN